MGAFVFTSALESEKGDAHRDIITDFTIGEDHIGLCMIDANKAVGWLAGSRLALAILRNGIVLL